MNKDDYLEAFSQYLNNKIVNYALLFDGKWGSGKTYFIENELINNEKFNNKMFIYVSVYGDDSIEDITGKIVSKLLPIVFPKKFKKASKFLENISDTDTYYSLFKMTFKRFSNALSINNATALEFLLSIASYLDIVFIIDDLERAAMPINLILGFLNDLVEHYNKKLIIIANESEIKELNFQENIELRYLATLLNLKANDSKDNTKTINYLYNDNNNFKYNPKTLENESLKMFKSNINYSQIKEKLIGITIYYKPNFENVFDNIVSKIKSNGENSDYIEFYKEYLLERFLSIDCYNNRTLTKIINFTNIFLNSLSIEDFDSLTESQKFAIEEIMNSIVYSFANFDEGQLKFQSYNPKINFIDQISYIRFNFIDDYLFKGFYSASILRNEYDKYSKYVLEYNKSVDDSLNQLIKYWWKIDDNVIETLIKDILKKLSDNVYSSATYPNILLVLIKLNNIGFNESYLCDAKIFISNNIKSDSNRNFEDMSTYYLDTDNNKEIEKYEEIVNEIKMDINNEENVKKAINKIIKFTNNSSGFYDYINKHQNEIIANNKFLSLINIDDLVKSIEKSKTEDIVNYRKAFQIYNKDLFVEEYGILKDFSIKLQNIKNKTESKTKLFNIDLFVTYLDQIISKIDKIKSST